MDDIFDNRPGEVRPDVDINRLLFEAKAEHNTLEKAEDDAVFKIARSIGEKLGMVADAVGRGGPAFAARKMKIPERQARNFIEFAKLHPETSRETKRSVLWGYGGTSTKPKLSARPQPITAYNRSKAWGGCNRWTTNVEALARENDRLKDSSYLSFVEAIEVAKTRYRELENKIKQSGS